MDKGKKEEPILGSPVIKAPFVFEKSRLKNDICSLKGKVCSLYDAKALLLSTIISTPLIL